MERKPRLIKEKVVGSLTREVVIIHTPEEHYCNLAKRDLLVASLTSEEAEAELIDYLKLLSKNSQSYAIEVSNNSKIQVGNHSVEIQQFIRDSSSPTRKDIEDINK